MTKPTSKSDASRIQSTQAKAHHDVGKGSFASRAQSAADRQAHASSQQTNDGHGAGARTDGQALGGNRSSGGRTPSSGGHPHQHSS
ncbi:hypothetical protein DM01DRAFT_1340825 [Hesseltinella vesiculosa]|uniref:SMP domain-containing protein n=1 Tax=Hesseltinella vesiculosa TaxID=101127 RepID=A0A1X2G2W6_9FUNG|nr:hypothetical protein DM01DRAFT_1340825 [Hesseltinella vesiculosa]